VVIEMSDSSTAAGLAGRTPDDGVARGTGDRAALSVAVGLALGVVEVGLAVGLGVGVVSTGLVIGDVATGVGVGEASVGLGEGVVAVDAAAVGPEPTRPDAPVAMDTAAASTRKPAAPMARERRRPEPIGCGGCRWTLEASMDQPLPRRQQRARSRTRLRHPGRGMPHRPGPSQADGMSEGADGDSPGGSTGPGGGRPSLSVRQAAFIGVGSMVGAGIFALLGTAGEVAGSAVWISFLLAGGVAALQGYSFAKMGSRYPTGGGFLEYVVRGWGQGHFTGVIAWMLLAVNAIITAMVAVSFGSYASAAVADNEDWISPFAVLVLLVMTALNVLGSQVVARAQTMVVVVVVGILTVFSVATLSNIDPDLLAFSGYPSLGTIVSSVALTFFAFLGFGVITFTAKDLTDPARELPRAVYLALAIATTVYVAVALGVFGTLTVDEVVDSGGTALAVAAEPVLGSAGYWLMTVTALFATAGATNSGLYPATGLGDEMSAAGQFPPAMGRRVGGRASMGIVVTAVAATVLALFFDLNAIASIGSAVALVVFTLVTFGHYRIRHETGAQAWLLVLAEVTTVVVLIAFAATTLVDEPGTAIALVVILVLSVVLDAVWKSRRDTRPGTPHETVGS
jgi:amino acid transporter